jgi:hypothetical protein
MIHVPRSRVRCAAPCGWSGSRSCESSGFAIHRVLLLRSAGVGAGVASEAALSATELYVAACECASSSGGVVSPWSLASAVPMIQPPPPVDSLRVNLVFLHRRVLSVLLSCESTRISPIGVKNREKMREKQQMGQGPRS